MADFALPTVRGPRACHLEIRRRILAEAASAVIYILVGLVVLIVVLVIANARRGGPEATRTGGHAEDGFGVDGKHDLHSADGFAAWVNDRLRFSHPVGTPCPAERHGSPRWIVEDGQVLGAMALRHRFDDDLGHIGYGVRPSARRRGLASWALGEMLVEAHAALGVDRLLVPCLANNTASARTIERCGGVLEGIRATVHGPVRR